MLNRRSLLSDQPIFVLAAIHTGPTLIRRCNTHPFYCSANQFRDIGYNLQRTEQSEFYHWHVDSGPGDFSKRQLVAIWYLNSSSDSGGETEFFHQKVSVKPLTGMLLLFPPFWTHLHRGTVVESGVKYIATTWVCID